MNRKDLSSITAIVFDFDGTLTIGGEDIKREAWKPIVKPWKDEILLAKANAEEKFRHGKGSRHDILRETFKLSNFAEDEIVQMADAYAAAYDALVQKMLRQGGMPEGTEGFLKDIHRMFDLYVNSATPKDALCVSVRSLGIARYFRAVLGMPKSKIENLQMIVQKGGLRPKDILFVGDGLGDLKAAKEFGCNFVGIPKSWNLWKKGKTDFPLIDIVTELPKLLS
ncbi:MAG: HAD family hydrolase [bacterium]|nr:HAD family hydrolase [bacterium]